MRQGVGRLAPSSTTGSSAISGINNRHNTAILDLATIHCTTIYVKHLLSLTASERPAMTAGYTPALHASWTIHERIAKSPQTCNIMENVPKPAQQKQAAMRTPDL